MNTLSFILLNARSALNEAQLIQELILDETADLACVTETLVGAEGGVIFFNLPTWIFHPTSGETGGAEGGVAIIYRNILEVVKTLCLEHPRP